MAEKKPLVVGTDGLLRQFSAASEVLPGGSVLRLYQVRTRTSINVNLATALENGDSQGGVTLATGDKVLVYNQTDPKENGVYTVKASGTPDRSPGGETGDSLLGALVVVTEGGLAGRVFLCTGTAPAVVGTDNIVFAEAAGVDCAFESQPNVFSATNGFTDLRVYSVNVLGFRLRVAVPSGLTADRTLTVNVDDDDRTLTIPGDATVQGDQTGVNGESVLGAGFTITGATGVYQDTGLSVTLPSAGTYLVFMTTRGIAQFSAGTINYLTAKLYNSTLAADVAGSECIAVDARTVSLTEDEVQTIPVLVTTSGAEDIELHAARNFDGTASLSSIATQITKIAYIKLK